MDVQEEVLRVDGSRYLTQMVRVKRRIDEVRRLLEDVQDEFDLIYAALQLRLALEEVALASLVGNRTAIEAAERSLNVKKWDDAAKLLRGINPDYWPRGVEDVDGDFKEVSGAIQEREVAALWGRLSCVLHAQNPWSERPDWPSQEDFLRHLCDRLVQTLNSHVLSVRTGASLLYCTMWSDPPKLYPFVAVTTEDELSPTP